jgi:hypothetical protein
MQICKIGIFHNLDDCLMCLTTKIEKTKGGLLKKKILVELVQFK